MVYIAGVAVSPSTGDEVGGNTVTLTLTMSAAVTVVGNPTLTLNDGGTAAYVGTAQTGTQLIFTYTVGSEHTPALGIASVNLNGGTVTGSDNNGAADFSAAATSFGGLQVNTGWGLFSAAGQGGFYGLWATDGTGVETRELHPAGADPFALAPHEITALGNLALFEGSDNQGHRGLWVSDGTSAGTFELTATDVNPQHLYAYGNYVLFQGTGADGHQDLWVSDGSQSGTHEVNLSDAYSGGIFANTTIAQAVPDFTGVGNYVLFNGAYANTAHPADTELQGLWAFDITTLTATQLVVPRTPQNPAPAFDPQDMFSYGGTVYFLGYGTHGQTPAAFIPDLWVTDGTVAGTHDIGEGVAEATEGLYPQYFAAVGGRVAFSGYSGPNLIRNELWVTNGTTAGTIRLTSTTPAAEGVYGITPQFLTSFGDRIVFSGGGIDGSSIRGLWISDGTADGTHELTVAGASNSGLFAAGVSPNFTAYGDTALFAGRDVAGLIGLWRTDGTNTQEIWSGAISITSQHGLDPKNFSVVDGKVLFTGYDNDGNSALFEYNGTTVTELSVNGAQQYTFNPSAVTPMQDALPEEQAPCFCRGTRILTEAGEVPVEALKIGDRVVTWAGEAKAITWIGSGRRLLTASDAEARPLIVRAGALADGMPRRDLYLTRGHSLYLDGILVPVEFLVNGRSILFDAAAREIEFYHIELAEHEVLIAEGAPAESYRDDGNRLLFDNPDPPRFAAANMPSYAPVLTGGPEVEALWRRLLERSGFVPPEASADPGLHLIADGRRIDPEPLETRPHGFQGIYRFRLEQAPLELAIVSRSTVPAAMGLNHDARRLGVALRSISLRGAGCAIDLDYDSPWLDDGFHRPEHSARHRWTNGHAPLPRDCHRLFDGEIEVLLEIVCTARYPLADQPGEAVLLAAA